MTNAVAGPELLYFHDPMCSWCWGFRSTVTALAAALPAQLAWRNVLGGLAPDSELPMPLQQQAAIQSHWRTIEAKLGVPFNHNFWVRCQPRRSTYPACRAVIAAARQEQKEKMLEAIQHAYYLQARNPSDLDTLTELAREIGLNVDEFAIDLRSTQVDETLATQIAETRAMGVSSFPSLRLVVECRSQPIDVDYQSHVPMLQQIQEFL